MLEHSGLLEHYRNEREGADRVENLDELVNAAESFVMQEGFGREAAGLARWTSSPRPVEPEPCQPRLERRMRWQLHPGRIRRHRRNPLALGSLPDPRRAGGRRQPWPQAGQDAIQLMTVHSGQGPGIRLRVHHRHGRGLVPARELHERPRRSGGRAPPDVRGHHPRAQAPVPQPFADPHAARADALQPQEPLL